MTGLSEPYDEFECISLCLISGEGIGLGRGVSPRDVAGEEATFASRIEALVGLPDDPAEPLREATGTCVVRHGEETTEGVRGGRRLPDLDRLGASVGSE